MNDAGGYDANVANANAVTQLPATEYSDETKFLTLADGYDQLPITLAEGVQRRMRRQDCPRASACFMNHRLAEIVIGSGELALHAASSSRRRPSQADEDQSTSTTGSRSRCGPRR